MSAQEQLTALIVTFSEPRHVDEFLDELKRTGFKDAEIGVIAPRTEPAHVEEGAMAGALTGGALGAVAGAAATGLIPGVGPVVAAGLLTGVLGGAAAGATAGGVLGALIALGLSEDEAHRYEKEILTGRTLVVVQAVGRGGEALAISQRVKRQSVPREEAAPD